MELTGRLHLAKVMMEGLVARASTVEIGSHFGCACHNRLACRQRQLRHTAAALSDRAGKGGNYRYPSESVDV